MNFFYKIYDIFEYIFHWNQQYDSWLPKTRPWATRWWKLHDPTPTVISFDLLPACDGQTTCRL